MSETLTAALAVSQIIIGALAVLVVIIAWVEYSKVKGLRQEVRGMLDDLKERQRRAQKAQQRIIASYHVTDIDRRIALIKSAVEADPDTFNGFNALGYAYLEKNDLPAAVAAFLQSTVRHPQAKEGWIDLAHAYIAMKRFDLAKESLCKAIAADPSAKDDIEAMPELSNLLR